MKQIPDMTAEELIVAHFEVDDFTAAETKRFAEFLKPYRERDEAIKAKLFEMIQALGKSGKGLKTDAGTAYMSTIVTPKISEQGAPYMSPDVAPRFGRTAFLDFCLDNWDTFGNEALQIGAPQKDAIEQYRQTHDGALPPGVEITSFTRVNIRRS